MFVFFVLQEGKHISRGVKNFMAGAVSSVYWGASRVVLMGCASPCFYIYDFK
jgi:hypothetical protein